MTLQSSLKIFLVLGLSTSMMACSPAQPGSGEFSAGIIGGNDVEAASRVSRSVVAIFAKGFGLCTGTLITRNAILTAGHCVPQDPSVKLMVVFATNVKAAGPQNMRPVTRVYLHEKYRSSLSQKNKGDIAVMKFSGDMPSGYSPVNLVPHGSMIANGSFILLSGYGVNNGVDKTGSGILRDTASIITNAQYSNTEIEIDQRNGRGSCNGDSGGPAFVLYQNAYHLWGVVSRGDRNCAQAGVYTNALVYRQWIQERLLSL